MPSEQPPRTDGPPPRPGWPPSTLPVALMLALTAALMALTAARELQRYDQLRLGWSWDLAYYNQWYWALLRGDGVLSVRPISSYGDEGPSVWRMNYLTPIRFAIIPFYLAWPDPRLLLVVHGVLFWLVIPAAYLLVRGETGSPWLAAAALPLVASTPLLTPLAINDFRELHLGIPFVLIAAHGWRGRHLGWTALGVAGMLACRQEYAVVLATLPALPPRRREDIGRTVAWAQIALAAALCWFLFAFCGYLVWTRGPSAPGWYVAQFGGERPALGAILATALEFLGLGLGAWSVLGLVFPRAFLLVLPWVWSLSAGKWALGFLATSQWHHVRYTAPMVGAGLAAGLLGYSRLAAHLRARPRGWALLAALGLIALAANVAGWVVLQRRLDSVPPPVDPRDVAPFWAQHAQVQPSDGVLAAYEFTAPLSSRRHLYSYVLIQNRPKHYPEEVPPEIRWAFIRTPDLGRYDVNPQIFESQGFQEVYSGPSLTVYRRR